MDSCGNDLKPGTKLPFCVNCRSSLGRWSKRRPAEVLERRRKLHLYDNRMSELVSVKRR